MAPYLLFGFLAAGVLSVLISPDFIERHLGGRGLLPVLKSAAFGVPLPLCSCGVIPVAASLRRHGASKGATTAFLISTPQTGVDSILVTLSLLGPVFAIFRPVLALISGVVGGAAVDLLTHDASAPVEKPPRCEEACCAGEKRGKLRHVFSYGFLTLPRDIGKSLLVGLVLAALITAFTPDDYFAPLLGGGIGAIVLLMLAGIPIYVCATASVPIAAALICRGVSPGAAFAFLVTGPATNAATLAIIWKVMGRRTTFIYLATMAVAALAGGLLLDLILPAASVAHHGHDMGGMLPKFVGNACAVALLALLAVALFRPVASNGHDHEAAGLARGEQTETLKIAGMTCSHCAASVRRALLECPGVQLAEVDLAAGKAVVAGEDLSLDDLKKAVRSLGYTVKDA